MGRAWDDGQEETVGRPSLSLRERQHRLREDAILEAAQELLGERGYERMSMDDLAARVGVSKKTLYQHFSGKEDLAVSVIVRAMRRAEENVRDGDPSLPAIERLELVVLNSVGRRAGLGPTRIPLPSAVVERHASYRAQLEGLMAALSELVEAAKAEGSIEPQLPTPLVARTLFYAVREADFRGLSQDLYSPDDLGKALVTILFEGVRRRGSG